MHMKVATVCILYTVYSISVTIITVLEVLSAGLTFSPSRRPRPRQIARPQTRTWTPLDRIYFDHWYYCLHSQNPSPPKTFESINNKRILRFPLFHSSSLNQYRLYSNKYKYKVVVQIQRGYRSRLKDSPKRTAKTSVG